MSLEWILVVFLLSIFGFIFFKWFRESLQKDMKALSWEMMERNNRSFLDLAQVVLDKHHSKAEGDLAGRKKEIEAVLVPLHASLEKLERTQKEMEKQREGAYGSLSKQLEMLLSSENELRAETAQLAQSLHTPHIRGSWGQMHLKRVVELSGMMAHCDFFEQVTVNDDDKSLRPDLVVKLPGERTIVIDAKVPLQSYLEAMETKDEERKKVKFQEHAFHVKKHIRDLSRKEYWKFFPSTPEYVILFLPAESFFSAAMQEDPLLIEVGASANVILATPTTLIAILRAISYGWKQESMSKNAKEIAKIGKELYERVEGVKEHWVRVGKSLSAAVESYNHATTTLETRVLVSLRKLNEYGIAFDPKTMESLEEIMKIPRQYKEENKERV
ncbi:MAG: DNA recombination protein RmuC [Chlamydiota bacterium]